MPAGQFDQGRLLGDVGDREVIMRVSAARINLDGPAQGGFGRSTQALLAKREAEGVLDLGSHPARSAAAGLALTR